MAKQRLWILFAILIGGMALTSCSDKDGSGHQVVGRQDQYRLYGLLPDELLRGHNRQIISHLTIFCAHDTNYL